MNKSRSCVRETRLVLSVFVKKKSLIKLTVARLHLLPGTIAFLENRRGLCFCFEAYATLDAARLPHACQHNSKWCSIQCCDLWPFWEYTLELEVVYTDIIWHFSARQKGLCDRIFFSYTSVICQGYNIREITRNTSKWRASTRNIFSLQIIIEIYHPRWGYLSLTLFSIYAFIKLTCKLFNSVLRYIITRIYIYIYKLPIIHGRLSLSWR